MNSPTDADQVVNGYTDRARFARAETDAVAPPRMLPGLLGTARHVTELPCGAGHFLDQYSAARLEVTLVDGNQAMLAAAVDHAGALGIAADRVHGRAQLLQDLAPLPSVDLAVIPNGALNQLACQTRLVDLLTGIRGALSANVHLLAQVLCSHGHGQLDASGFYDRAREPGCWFADRHLPSHTAAVYRYRRQHHASPEDLLRVEFDYRAGDRSVHTTAVTLRVLSPTGLLHAMAAAGFTPVHFLPGHGGLSEILARTDGGAL
jgi:hypothetical protein